MDVSIKVKSDRPSPTTNNKPITANNMRPTSELENSLRLQLNRMMQITDTAKASRQQQLTMRSANLHTALDHMANEAQLQRQKMEGTLQMKVERRRAPRPQSAMAAPALVPKKREDEKV